MSEAREKLVELVAHVCSRPGMYVGQSSLCLVLAYLRGYEHASIDGERVAVFGDLMTWLMAEHRIHHPAWGLARLLIHRHGTPTAALKSLPDDLRLCLSSLDAIGDEGLNARLAEVDAEWQAIRDPEACDPYSTWPSSMPIRLVHADPDNRGI